MIKPVALITGAASGLGKATAELLSKDHMLVLCDISERTLEEFCLYLSQKGTEVYPVVCDVSKETDVTTAVDTAVKIGKIRSVFHSAGVSPTLVEDGEQMYRINLLGTAYLIKALAPHMKNGASAICVASQAAYFAMLGVLPEQKAVLENPLAEDFFDRLKETDPDGNLMIPETAYGLSKLGVRYIVEHTATDWGENNARINTISPGIIETPMTIKEAEQQPGMQIVKEQTPLKRWGQPVEIANVARFLLSAEASFITGVDLLVDGGSTNRFVKAITEGQVNLRK